MLRIKLKFSYFGITLYWNVDILTEHIETIIMILDFNIEAIRRKNCNVHFLL